MSPTRGTSGGTNRRYRGTLTQGEHHRDDAREQRDDHGLGELGAEELQATGADRAADGEFPLPPLRADQEEVAHVGAGDEQHDGHRSEQDPDRAGHLAH